MIRESLKVFIRVVAGKYNRIVYHNAEFLCNGIYKINPAGTIIYLDGRHDVSHELASNMFDIKYKKRNVGALEKILKKYFISSISKNKVFQGELVLLTSSKQEYKIFDYVSGQVLTVFGTPEKFKKYKENMMYFKRFFSIPNVYQCNDEKKYFIEELIKQKNIENIKVDFKRIVASYLPYFQYCKENNQVQYINIQDLKPSSRSQFIVDLYEGLKDVEEFEKIPFTKLHGDLWKSNILIDESDCIHIIDWERCDDFHVFYDMFTFVLNEATLNGNHELLESFLNGDYDDILSEYYQVFGLQYDKGNKKKYFQLFILLMYRDRWTACFEKVEKDIKEFMESNQLLS